MGASNVIVTNFKVDYAHVAMEDVGKISAESKKPAFLASKKVLAQMKKSGDISVGTPSKLDKAIAAAKKKYGFMGEYAEEIKDKGAYVKDQAGELKKKANELSQAGKGAYKTYYSDPIAYCKSTKSNIFNNVRSVAGLRFKIDDLLIGEGARKLLMEAIKGVCGSGNLSPMEEIFKAYKDLLKILDNINLFSNSDLLSAIGKCEKFNDDHAKILTAKTSDIAAEGNPTAYADMVAVPGVKSNSEDIIVLMANSEDNEVTGDKVVSIYETTGRPVKNIIITEVPTVNEYTQTPETPVDVINSFIINRGGNHKAIVDAAVKKINHPASPKALNKSVSIMNPSSSAPKEEKVLKNLVDQTLKSPVIKANEIKVSTSLRTSSNTDIDTGNIRNVDTSIINQIKKTVATSTKAPSSWNNASVETIAPPITTALDTYDPIVEIKKNNCDYIHIEAPVTTAPVKKTFRQQTPWFHISPDEAIMIKRIKSWKERIDKDSGDRFLIPVY